MAGDASVRKTTADGPGPAARPGPGLRLVVVGPVASGRYARRSLERGRLLVGRAADNDLSLDEASVSARHARIDVEPAGVFLTDLGSTNGTWLNGTKVTGSVQLQSGDQVSLGRCRLRIESGGTEGGAPGDGVADAAPDTAATGPVIPARHRRRLLVSFDAADEQIGERIVERLDRIGHTVVVQRGLSADSWGGRLLDTVWSVDAVVFVVSAAAAASEKVHREVHLAGAERTTVIPVRIDDTVLPADLAFYERREPIVDLRPDLAAGLSELQRRLDGTARKRIARPWRLARRVVAGAAVVGVVATLALLVLR